MKTIQTIFFLLLLLVSANTIKAESEDSFRLGLLLCLTGDCAEWGQNSLKGIKLAVNELNNSGGILGRKIEIATQDTREGGSGANSVSAYRALTTDKNIKFIIGPTWSIGGLPLAPIISKKNDLIVTSPSLGVAEFNETSDNLFNTWPHDAISTAALADYAFKKGWKRAAVWSGNDPWVMVQGNTFAKEFESLGGEIVIKVELDPNSKDVKPEALRVKKNNPDVIFYADTYTMGLAAKELKRLQYSGNQLAILMDETRVKDAAGAFNETIFAMYPEASASFLKHYQQEYNEKPGITADTAYDTVKLYAAAITQANSFDPLIVKKTLSNVNYEGASGKIIFDGKGGVIKTPVFWRVAGEKFELVK